MIPEDAKLRSTTSGSNDTVPFYMTEFEQLMMEANAVLSRYVLDAIGYLQFTFGWALDVMRPVTDDWCFFFDDYEAYTHDTTWTYRHC